MIHGRAARRVVITGVGAVGAPFTGGWAALGGALSEPRLAAGRGDPGPLSGLMEGLDTRRLSRVCQLAVAAALLAVRDAGEGGQPPHHDPSGPAAAPLGLVVGTELGDLRSTREFVDGYRARGPAGLSALLFPNTVMNTMAAAVAIALEARGISLTINAPGIPGELAVARAAASIGEGRAERLLAGGVDELEPCVAEVLAKLGVDTARRGEGAAFLMLESLDGARARAARLPGEILGVATGALPARPLGVGRGRRSRAVEAALERAGRGAQEVGWVYASGGGDPARDRWEQSVIEAALAPHRPPAAALGHAWGQHAGLGALRVAAAAWTAHSGLLPGIGSDGLTAPAPGAGLRRVPAGPGLVHALARGGGHAAIVVGPPGDR
jgi:3-oxoacyl-(acyl-carrier-protein) synthase